MAVLQWVIICERAIVEEQARTVSLMSIVETITLPPPPPEMLTQEARPLVPFRFYVVHQWSRSNPKIGERAAGRVLLVGPNGEEFGTSEFVVDLTASERARVIGQTIGFPLFGAGVYKCLVQSKVRTRWRKLGQTEFGVTFVDGSANPQRQPTRRH